MLVTQQTSLAGVAEGSPGLGVWTLNFPTFEGRYDHAFICQDFMLRAYAAGPYRK
jgi:hypothetical protein